MTSSRLRPGAALVCALAVLIAVPALRAQTDAEFQKKLESIDWKTDYAHMDGIASVRVPKGYVAATGKDVAKLMEMTENPETGREVGFIAPESLEWFAVFEFDKIGYVKDDDRDALDSEKLLTSMREGTEQANEERRRRGWAPIHVVGWEIPPRYNAETQNLEWALRLESEGVPVVNHNTRLLGRRGVMEATLVCDPEQLPTVLPAFRHLLTGYVYGSGQKYAEFRQGDKVAAVGLAALITGGAAVAATKTGFLAKFVKGFGKIIVAAVAGLAALVAKLFGKKKEA
jgi:uncharacterized membrane-anchored protein